jgi:hypothetical protein
VDFYTPSGEGEHMVTYDVNVVVHIDEELSASEIHNVERSLSSVNGIVSACAHEKTPHLLVVDYDPRTVRAGSVLQHLKNDGLHAELIGGV